MDYDTSLVFGYKITRNTIKNFIKHVKEKSHIEERWDPKTGKKLEPELVIDRKEADVIVFNGVEYYDEYDLKPYLRDFLDAVADEVGAGWCIGGNLTYGEMNDIKYYITVNTKKLKTSSDDCESYIDFDKALILQCELDKLGDKLRKLGIKVGKPVIAAVTHAWK